MSCLRGFLTSLGPSKISLITFGHSPPLSSSSLPPPTQPPQSLPNLLNDELGRGDFPPLGLPRDFSTLRFFRIFPTFAFRDFSLWGFFGDSQLLFVVV